MFFRLPRRAILSNGTKKFSKGTTWENHHFEILLLFWAHRACWLLRITSTDSVGSRRLVITSHLFHSMAFQLQHIAQALTTRDVHG